MFSTNTNIIQMEQMASFEDAEPSNDIIIQAADVELFTDNLNEIFQTGVRNRRRSRRVCTNSLNRREEEHVLTRDAGTENNVGRKSRSAHSNSLSQREEEHVSRDTDQPRANPSDTQRTAVTHAIVQTTQITQHDESQMIDFDSDNEFSNMQDRHRENPSDTQRTAITHTTVQTTQITHDESQIIDLDSENEFSNTQDRYREDPSDTQRTTVTDAIAQTTQTTQHYESEIIDVDSENDALIYEVPEDDYAHLYSTNTNASTEDLPFHAVNWNLQTSQSTSQQRSSQDTCTVCYIKERTHIFVPCSHFVCCFQCIERLEA